MKFIEYVKLPLKKSHTSCDPCMVLSQGGPRQEGAWRAAPVKVPSCTRVAPRCSAPNAPSPSPAKLSEKPPFSSLSF